MEALNDVWAGDLLNRREEAEDLIGYLESVASRAPIREDGHAHVVALDTSYGQGKTFFLRRLDRHLRATEHVSAFVDAWVDDLEDEPIVALAATLDKALKPWAEDDAAVEAGLTQFKAKAGRVAKIVGVGLAKRGVGFLITQGAAEALGDELTKASEIDRDIRKDALKDGAAALVNDVSARVVEPPAPSMDARIAKFRDGQQAIQDMKDSLSDVVAALVKAGMKLPITIIVDELDRCRPTYAIKVLEEIKHLFDVDGVAFVLGLHGRQLAHSVGAAYGVGFDGEAYLRRFFNKRYALKPSQLRPLIAELISRLRINPTLMDHMAVLRDGKGRAEILPPEEVIATYLAMYELSARDAFSIMEALQTAMALVGKANVQLSYLIPLLITQYLGSDDLMLPTHDPSWKFVITTDHFGQNHAEQSVKEGIEAIHHAAQLSDQKLSEMLNLNSQGFGVRMVVDYGFANGSKEYKLLQNYIDLVKTVRQFT
ncbi:KAP family P-loop NTPase fold protein [Sphingomonas aerolata]|uniref:KAP family P-loop NTPase fold protein n=1 Tax=Sphingomonas aerolata TaxID=185951 RepID=UPI003364AC04